MSVPDRRHGDRRRADRTPPHVCAIVLVDVRELEDAAALVDAALALGTHAALEVALDLTGAIVKALAVTAADAEPHPCPHDE